MFFFSQMLSNTKRNHFTSKQKKRTTLTSSPQLLFYCTDIPILLSHTHHSILPPLSSFESTPHCIDIFFSVFLFYSSTFFFSFSIFQNQPTPHFSKKKRNGKPVFQVPYYND
eukprot:UN02355